MRARRISARFRPLEERLLLLTMALGSVLVAIAIFNGELYFNLEEEAYSVLHSMLELASILVSFAVFIVNWEASKQSRNSHTLFIATGFLAVAIGDIMHTLSFPGMPAFVTPNDVEKSVYFWLFARLWAGGVLLSAAFIPSQSTSGLLSRYPLAASNLIACLVAFAAVTYFPAYLPSVFVAGEGLTALKFSLEHVVVVLYLAAAIVYWRRYRRSDDPAIAVLVAALVVGVFSEVCFTLVSAPFDVYNLLGHAYKVVAYYLVFRALLVTSVERPYVQLRKANADLERAVAELHERTRELDALDEIALTLSSSLRPEEVLALAIEKVMSVMQARAGAIFLAEEETGSLHLAAWRGLGAGMVARLQAHPAELARVGAIRASATVGTALDEPALLRTLGGSAAHLAPLRSCICAPVTTKGQMLGAMAVIAGEGRTLNPADADLLTAVGYQLGLSIENARLYGRTDERLREKLSELGEAERKSRFLAEAAALLASSMDLELVLGIVARKSTEVVGDWCAVYLGDAWKQPLKLAAVHHDDQEELAAIRGILELKSVVLAEGLLGQVAQSGRAVLVVGEAVGQLGIELESLADTKDEMAMIHRVLPSSAIVAPMRAHGRTVGVLLVTETHSTSPMDERDLALVRELGDRAGIAIQNSQLLEESQERRRHLEAIISQMVDGVVIADAEGAVVIANAAAKRMLLGQLAPLSKDAIAGDEVAEAGAEAQVGKLIRRAITGLPLVGEEIVVVGDSGERILSASASAVRGEQGVVTGAVVVMRDVTAEREVDRMKDEFVATVSHELRTPITAVLGYTDLMLRGLRGPVTPAQAEALTSVKNSGRRLLTLIEDLLDMSKLEAGKQELSIEAIDVAPAVERAISAVALAANTKKIRLARKIPPGLPPVLADDSLLQRILGNLMSNALKFTPPGGNVTVSAAPSTEGGPDGPGQRPTQVTVTVMDTGVGIPREKQERIWDKFQQADSSSSRVYGGTGLGLAIVKALVELHGGTVFVQSEGIPGKGSSFGFSLPVADAGSGT